MVIYRSYIDLLQNLRTLNTVFILWQYENCMYIYNVYIYNVYLYIYIYTPLAN